MNLKEKKGNNETDVQKYFKYAQAEATELLCILNILHMQQKSEDREPWLIVLDLDILPSMSVQCPLHNSEVTTPIFLQVHTDKCYSKGHIKL